ncbi:MAG: oligosaccharide flippase family protein [Desulfobulbus sp.]|jgi:O-antigen/teichoic acid export membrane protein|nr:oligosaccharide flippase family protein [Desulfobulbus sp.]
MAFKLEWLIKVLPKGSFLQGVLALASGTVAAQIVTVLASPLLTRFYTPADFGVLAVFIALLSVLSVVSSVRYELAIPLATTSAEALNILALAVSINIVCSLVIGLLLLGLHGEIISLLDVPLLAPYLWVLPIGVILVGTYRALTFWAVREKIFSIIARTKLTQAVLGVGTQLALGVAHGGPLGLITGQVISQSAGMMVIGHRLSARFKKVKRSIKLCRMATSAIRYARFPKFDLAAAAANTTAANLPQFLLAALFFPAVAGHYLLAWRVVSMPVSVLGQAVGQALYAQAREAAKKGRLFRFVCQIAGVLGLLMVVPLTGMFAWGEQLFTLVFGPDWGVAGRYAGWLILGASVQFVYSPISFMLLATNSQHVNLAIQLFLLAAKSGAIIFGFLKADPLLAIIALASADAVGYSLGVLLTLRQVKQYQGLQCLS